MAVGPTVVSSVMSRMLTTGGRLTLYHYTTSAGREGIMESGEIVASRGWTNARHGAGVYLTDIAPEMVGGRTIATAGGRMSLGQLSRDPIEAVEPPGRYFPYRVETIYQVVPVLGNVACSRHDAFHSNNRNVASAHA